MIPLLALALAVLAPLPAPGTITFHFLRPGLPTPEYTFTIQPDGTLDYRGTILETASHFGSMTVPLPNPTPAPITAHGTITPATYERLLAAAPSLPNCASKAKNIADTGQKTLSIIDSSGQTSSCTFNYSGSKAVTDAVALLQAMALTLEEGRRLDFEHRYDHLGLDREMITFSDALRDGRAAEPGLIASTLRMLVEDPHVLERVRTRASALLSGLPPS